MHTVEREERLESGPLPSPGEAGDDVSLLDVLIILARRKKFIAAFTVIVAVLSALVAILLPVKYTATAVVLPPQSSSSTGSAVMSQLGALGAAGAMAGSSLGIKNPNDMYVAMFRSRTLEDAMIKRFDLQGEYRAGRMSLVREEFEKHSEVLSGAKDNLITVSVQDHDPKRAADMANAYVDEYKKFSASLALTEASQRRVFFEDQLQQAKSNLANAEEALKKTEQTSGLVQIDSQARALIESAASLRAQIAAKQVEIRGMRSFASEQNPDLQVAEQQLAGWQSQLSSLGGAQSGSGDDMILPKGQVPAAGLEYVRKLRDVKYYDTIFDLLAKQFEIAKLDEARQGSMVQVVDPAIVPDQKSSPKRTLIVAISTVIGFCFSILWVLIASGLERVRQNPENRQRIQTLAAVLRKP
ncbi:MAG TPA: GNVR domain-containing protein [Acidisarcina sp.]